MFSVKFGGCAENSCTHWWIAFNIDASRVEFAKKYAADIAVVPPKNGSDKGSLTSVKQFIGPLLNEYGLASGVDVAINASGSDTCVQMRVVIAKPGGAQNNSRWFRCGWWRLRDWQSRVSFRFRIVDIILWGWIYRLGTERYTLRCFADAIDLLARKKVDASSLIIAKYLLTNGVEVFKAQAAEREHQD